MHRYRIQQQVESESESESSSGSYEEVIVKKKKPSSKTVEITGNSKKGRKTIVEHPKPIKEAKSKVVPDMTNKYGNGTRTVYKNLSDDQKQEIITNFNKVSGNRQEKIEQVNKLTGYSKYMIGQVLRKQ